MKKIYGIIVSIALLIGLIAPVSINAKAASVSDISISGEYLIKDSDGLHSRYVVLATNNSEKDLTVEADFHALSGRKAVKTVHDCAEAVKAGQSFIVYGQFRNDQIAKASGYTYDLKVSETSSCKYDAVNMEITKSDDNTIIVTGTNYSQSDVYSVNTRCLFFKDGTPIAFDTVNIGDSGQLLRSGKAGVQQLGMIPVDYDDYTVTYSVSGSSAAENM